MGGGGSRKPCQHHPFGLWRECRGPGGRGHCGTGNLCAGLEILKRFTFLDHLEELRRRILISLAAITVFWVAAWFFREPLLDFLLLPLVRLNETELYFQAPYEAFFTHLKVSLLAGLLLASPVIFTQAWLFLTPGLYREERRIFLPIVFASIFFFLAGAAFAFWILVPFGLRFLLGFQTESLRPLLGIGPYFSFLIGMVLACGILFDLPVLVLGLVRAGVWTADTLSRWRKFAILFAFILAAILTPTPDPISQILLALPLVLLYESCLVLARWVEKTNP